MLLWIQRVHQQIGLRLALACFMISFFIACAIAGIQVWQERQKALAGVEQQLAQIERVFLPSLIDALWTLDPQRLKSQLSALQQLPLVSRIELDDDSGQHTDLVVRSSDERLLRQTYPLSYSIDGQTFALGELHIELDATEINQQLFILARSSLLTSFGALFLGNVVLVWLFHGWVTRQLNRVAEFAKQLSASTLATPIHLERSTLHAQDEIGSIVSAISQMQQQLHHEFGRREIAEQELKAHQMQLEQIVSKRTEQLEAQTSVLVQQSHLLLEQNAELNAFAHTVAHDLKHPLTNLIAMSSLLTKSSALLNPDKQQKLLTEIHESSIKMNSMINSLLQLASLRSDMEITKTEVDITATVQGALKHLVHFMADHQAEVRLNGAFPTLLADPQWVEEIWLNYLSNAIKYGGDKALIEVGADQPTADSAYWRFWVRDYGDGVAESRQSLLFIEFSRLHVARDDSQGLGLSIVKRICRKLGGSCGYERAEGGGSRFWFTLPA